MPQRWRRHTGDASSEESSQVAVEAGPHCDRGDVVTSVGSDGDHGAHVDANGGNTAEAAARVRRNDHGPILPRNQTPTHP